MRLDLDMDLVDVAMGRRPADVVFNGGQVVLVQTGEIVYADIAVASGRIAHVGDVSAAVGPETVVHDVSGQFILPGLIDGHLHPENSRLGPRAISDVLVEAGTTTIFTGLDHIAAAAGRAGVRAALDEFAGLDLNILWGSPFRLPYTEPASTINFRWSLDDHEEALDWPECIGLWELCPDFLTDHDPTTVQAIKAATDRGLGVHGSVPGAAGEHKVAAHVSAGLRVDHEADDVEQLLEKLRLGLFVMIRDSPVEPVLSNLIGLVVDNPHLAHHVGFCTDAFFLEDVRANGHVSKLVADAIKAGVPPMTAIQMATINTARAYRVDHAVGMLAPGRRADLLVTSSLTELTQPTVFVAGRLHRRSTAPTSLTRSPLHVDRFDRELLTPTDFAIPNTEESDRVRCRVIEMTDNAFARTACEMVVKARDGVIELDPASDLAVCAYVVRGTDAGPGLGLVTGFKLSDGAIATSSTPDDENILCVGRNPEDMAAAVNALIEQGGGDVVVVGGQVRALLPLPIAGIMSDLDPERFAPAQAALHRAVKDLGCDLAGDPFLYLGILAITGLPEIGMSEHGPVDFESRSVVPVIIAPSA